MKKISKKGFVKGFNWGLYPEAEKILDREIKNFLRHVWFVRNLSKRMQKKSSTRIFDWVDHIVIPKERVSEEQLKKSGLKLTNLKSSKGTKVFKNASTILFPVLLSSENKFELALKTDSAEECIKKINKKAKIEGEKYSSYRKAILHKQKNYVLSVIERRGTNDFVVKNDDDISVYKKALKIFLERKRNFENDNWGMSYTKNLVESVLKKLSSERAADAFFRAERIYWQSRNNAGKTQKRRQDVLGLGWGNHDHHTFRSSRENFAMLIGTLEKMGYKCRERFYAGERAGWGAQILEHPQCDIVVFADVDISKEEKDRDFAHEGLKEKEDFDTVGLWVALHGESILQAGLHHLEARFVFNKLRRDLRREGVKTMKPFSYFKFLKQAFTEGERWRVDKKRLDALIEKKAIDEKQYENFLKNGAIGSHLENLQRRQGYKGFNQDSVTAIIKATNPLKQLMRKKEKAA